MSFGLLCIPALPNGSDFWYYLAAGRLAATGADVYVQRLTPSSMVDLPISAFAQRVTMPYGPAWVWLSKLLSKIAGSDRVVEFVLYKGVLFGAWVATLGLVYRALHASPRRQVLAILIAGWLPLSVIFSVAEGHNDVVMVALMTAWLATARPSGGWLLVSSVLFKYVTAVVVPLAAVDAAIRRQWRTVVVLAVATLIAAAVLVSEWNDGALLAGLRPNQSFQQYTPVAFVRWVVQVGHLPSLVALLGIVVWRLLILGLLAWYGCRHLQRPSWTSLCACVTTVILAMLLGSEYVWPWYVTWVLPSLALALDPLLLALALPLIVMMPIIQILYLWKFMFVGRATAVLCVVVSACWLVTFSVVSGRVHRARHVPADALNRNLIDRLREGLRLDALDE